MLALQVLHDVQHLGLHADIQGRGRLVAHQELRLRGERAGDRDPLALAAGKLVRVLGHVQRRQADRLQQAADARFQFRFIRDDAVLHQRFADDVLHDPARVQAGVRILEDHLDTPAQLAAVGGLERGVGVLAVEGEAAAGRPVQAHQQLGHRALAAAGLADQGQRLAARDVEAHAVDRVEQLARLALDHPVQPGRRDVEGLGQVVRLHQRRGNRHCAHAETPALVSCSQHAARVAPASSRSGRSTRQRANTRGQRGL